MDLEVFLAVNQIRRRSGAGFRVCGFTLPEVLITLLLISILFTLSIFFISSFKSTKKMRSFEIAIALGQQAIEALRAAPFALIAKEDAKENSVEYDLNTASSGPGKVDLFEPEFKLGNVSYERKVEVTTVQPAIKGATSVGLKHVKVTVKWTPSDGETTTYEITTTISNIN